MEWLPKTLRRGEFAAAQDPENIGTRMIKAKLIEFARNGIGLTIQHTTSSIGAVEVVLKASGEVGIETRAGSREIRNGCKVFIRACPNSNDHLGSHWDGVEYRRFRLREWEQAGAVITLGTDQGAGSNCNLFMEMLDERRRHPAAFKPSYADLLRYGTLNGYRSLGIDFGHVNFKVGLPANFVVIRMAGAGNFYTNGDHHGNMETTASRTIHGGARTENILASYVNGKKLK